MAEPTLVELRRRVSETFDAAVKDGVLTKLALIAAQLGKKQGAEPSYTFELGKTVLHFDDRTDFIQVFADDKEVLTTANSRQKYIVPGPWLERLLAKLPEAQKAFEDVQALERQELQALLGEAPQKAEVK